VPGRRAGATPGDRPRSQTAVNFLSARPSPGLGQIKQCLLKPLSKGRLRAPNQNDGRQRASSQCRSVTHLGRSAAARTANPDPRWPTLANHCPPRTAFAGDDARGAQQMSRSLIPTPCRLSTLGSDIQLQERARSPVSLPDAIRDALPARARLRGRERAVPANASLRRSQQRRQLRTRARCVEGAARRSLPLRRSQRRRVRA
jgi:hypothetical protein